MGEKLKQDLKKMRRFKIWKYILIPIPILIFFNNCTNFERQVDVGGLSQSSGSSVNGDVNQGVCNDGVLQAVFASGYYSFVRAHKCALCHGNNGIGPGFGVDSLTQAYKTFQFAPGQFLAPILNSNAVDPSHHGAGDPANKSLIDPIANTWEQSVSANCKTTTIASSYSFRLAPKPVSLTPGKYVDLSWDLQKDLMPAASVSTGGVTFSMRVTASGATDVQAGYLISRMFVSTTTGGIKISGAKVEFNGEIYKYGSTFVNAIADLPAGISNFPMALGTIFVPTNASPQDQFSVRLGNIDVPTIKTNFAMGTGPGTTSTPPKFSELVAPGGSLYKNCVQCHNPIFKTANLNILDYSSVMQFVTPGLHSSHDDPLSPMIYLIGGTDPNVMPPAGLEPYSDLWSKFLQWFESGAPNN